MREAKNEEVTRCGGFLAIGGIFDEQTAACALVPHLSGAFLSVVARAGAARIAQERGGDRIAAAAAASKATTSTAAAFNCQIIILGLNRTNLRAVIKGFRPFGDCSSSDLEPD